MNHFKISTRRTAHYYTLGDVNSEVDDLWIVCHGYGQTAEDFLKEFQPIASRKRLIVAPEALSRFYWGGFTGPIACSWMTSKDRLSEIEDYCNWLDQLYDLLVPKLSSSVKITLLGFSQGTATVMRWLHARQPQFQKLILWAGLTPEDITYTHLLPQLPADDSWLIYGLQDRFLTEERIQWQRQFALEHKLPLQFLTFDGKHKIDAECLIKIAG